MISAETENISVQRLFLIINILIVAKYRCRMMYATVILSYFIYVEWHADIISARTSIGTFIT